MSYEDELLNDQFKNNVVIRINGGLYFARHQPDSGLSVPAAQRIMKGPLKVNSTGIDILEAKSSFGSFGFTLIDKDHIVTELFADNLAAFMNQRVEIWLGRITGSFAFADYWQLPDSFITGVGFRGEDFDFTCSEIRSQFKKTVFNTKCVLAATTTAGAATLVAADDISAFPSSGRLFIDDEFKNYSSKNNGTKTFTLSGTTANTHSVGSEIKNVTTITAENPVDILLRMLQSTGGGTYDDYTEGLGVADADLDIAGIETIRDENFSGELFSFEVFGMESPLEWMEQNILRVCSLRFITSSDSKLSLTVLDQSVFGAATRTLNSANIEPKSVAFNIDTSLVRNRVEFRYDYNYEARTYGKTYSLEDAESIANYGLSDVFIIEAQGVPDTAAGDLIAIDRASRWLARLKTANARVSVQSFFSQVQTLLGERVLVDYDLPTEVGTRLWVKEMEVLRKTVDEERGLIKFDLALTNYSGLRECFVSPSDQVASIVTPTVIEIASGRTALYKVGWKMAFYDDSAGAKITVGTSDNLGTIAALNSGANTVRFSAPFTTATLTAGNSRMKFPDYDEEMATEQRRYGFISDGSMDFVCDSTRPYQVTF